MSASHFKRTKSVCNQWNLMLHDDPIIRICFVVYNYCAISLCIITKQSDYFDKRCKICHICWDLYKSLLSVCLLLATCHQKIRHTIPTWHDQFWKFTATQRKMWHKYLTECVLWKCIWNYIHERGRDMTKHIHITGSDWRFCKCGWSEKYLQLFVTDISPAYLCCCWPQDRSKTERVKTIKRPVYKSVSKLLGNSYWFLKLYHKCTKQNVRRSAGTNLKDLTRACR